MDTIIDFSVFTKSSSLGHIHGKFELSQRPEVGEGIEIELSSGDFNKFKVEHVSEESTDEGKYILVMLEDLIVDSHKDFLKIGEYLEKRNGLYFDDFTTMDS
jgi:hypothetical protein